MPPSLRRSEPATLAHPQPISPSRIDGFLDASQSREFSHQAISPQGVERVHINEDRTTSAPVHGYPPHNTRPQVARQTYVDELWEGFSRRLRYAVPYTVTPTNTRVRQRSRRNAIWEIGHTPAGHSAPPRRHQERSPERYPESHLEGYRERSPVRARSVSRERSREWFLARARSLSRERYRERSPVRARSPNRHSQPHLPLSPWVFLPGPLVYNPPSGFHIGAPVLRYYRVLRTLPPQRSQLGNRQCVNTYQLCPPSHPALDGSQPEGLDDVCNHADDLYPMAELCHECRSNLRPRPCSECQEVIWLVENVGPHLVGVP